MNLIEILILAAFIFFPLLQALLEKLGGRNREEEPADPQQLEAPPPVATVEPPRSRERERLQEVEVDPGSWSSGWGHWPTETLEDLSAEEVLDEKEAAELVTYQEIVPDTQMSEAARVSVPVVSMEQLVVDRKAEHRRFHDGVSRPAPPRPSQPGEPLDGALRQPHALRRAIILSEVLGRPRSLQPLQNLPVDQP